MYAYYQCFRSLELVVIKPKEREKERKTRDLIKIRGLTRRYHTRQSLGLECTKVVVDSFVVVV